MYLCESIFEKDYIYVYRNNILAWSVQRKRRSQERMVTKLIDNKTHESHNWNL